MGLTDILKKTFPFISAAASLGGPPAALAANLLGKALGTENQPAPVEPTQAGVMAVLAKASATPEQLLAAQKAEIDLQLQKASLEPHHQEELERIAAADRASARERQIAVRDRVPAILALSVTVGFFALLFLMLKYPPPAANEKLLYLLLGTLSTAWVAIITYYFGSSAGSDRKTDLLGNLAQK